MKFPFRYLFCVLIFCLPGFAPSQAQIFDDTPLVVFRMNDGEHGLEPWISDGTEAGTRLLTDIRPGAVGSFPANFTATEDGRAFFSANDGVHGRELWVTDGTRGGTYMVRNIGNGLNGSSPTHLTYIGSGKVVFSAIGNTGGREPWISDGTAQGTFRLVNANPGVADSLPNSFTRLNDRVFMFTAMRNGEYRIWISDGTTAGTQTIPGPLRNGSDYTMLDETRVVFGAEHPVRGSQPWIFDLVTRTRPTLLRNINRNGEGWVYSFTRLANGSFVFVGNHPNHGEELFVTDGTRAGTSLLRRITPGGFDTFPYHLTPVDTTATQLVFATFQDPEANVAHAIWVTDGTRDGTTRIRNNLSVMYGLGLMAQLDNGRVLFAATDRRNQNSISRGRTLWVTDGTSGGTTEVFRPNGGQFSEVNNITPIGAGLALFTGVHRTTGAQVYLTDGTTQGTSRLTRINISGAPSPEQYAVIRMMKNVD